MPKAYAMVVTCRSMTISSCRTFCLTSLAETRPAFATMRPSLVRTDSWCGKMICICASPAWHARQCVPGASIMIPQFSHEHICFCAMHALNLGFTLWCCGSSMKMLIEHYGLWGDGPKGELFKSAWLHNNGWVEASGSSAAGLVP